MKKYGILIAAITLVVLQVRLWFGDGSLVEVQHLKKLIAAQQQENTIWKEKNSILEAEVMDLKQGLEAIEERARQELGMIKRNETFYQLLDQ